MQPFWKKLPPSFLAIPSQSWGPVKPSPFWKFGRRFKHRPSLPPSPAEREGVHTVWKIQVCIKCMQFMHINIAGWKSELYSNSFIENTFFKKQSPWGALWKSCSIPAACSFRKRGTSAQVLSLICPTGGINLFKVKNGNTRTMCEICLNWTINKQNDVNDVFIINFEHISHIVLVFPLLTWNK